MPEQRFVDAHGAHTRSRMRQPTDAHPRPGPQSGACAPWFGSHARPFAPRDACDGDAHGDRRTDSSRTIRRRGDHGHFPPAHQGRSASPPYHRSKRRRMAGARPSGVAAVMNGWATTHAQPLGGRQCRSGAPCCASSPRKGMPRARASESCSDRALSAPPTHEGAAHRHGDHPRRYRPPATAHEVRRRTPRRLHLLRHGAQDALGMNRSIACTAARSCAQHRSDRGNDDVGRTCSDGFSHMRGGERRCAVMPGGIHRWALRRAHDRAASGRFPSHPTASETPRSGRCPACARSAVLEQRRRASSWWRPGAIPAVRRRRLCAHAPSRSLQRMHALPLVAGVSAPEERFVIRSRHAACPGNHRRDA